MNITVMICMALLIVNLILCLVTIKNNKRSKITILVNIAASILMASGFILNAAQYTGSITGVFLKTSRNSSNQDIENIGTEYEKILDEVLQSSYGDEYTLTRNGLNFEITTQTAGLRNCVNLAQQGDQDSVDGWTEITSKLTEVSRQYYEMLSEQDISSVLLVWMISDDTNPDNALFITANGIPVYDAVNIQSENVPETN